MQKRSKPLNGKQIVEPLDIQCIASNSRITLKKNVMEELQVEPESWIIIIPGPVKGTIIIKKKEPEIFDYGPTVSEEH